MKIVWFCADRVGAEMAGPGIRAVELARQLAVHHAVTLVADGARSLAGEPFQREEPGGLETALSGADAFVTQGFGFPLRLARRFEGRLILDLYDPVQLEQLEQFGPRPRPDQRVSLIHVRARLLALLRCADHLLCASPIQRALWLGWLGSSGRLAPERLAVDAAARQLLPVVPFGLPTDPPKPGDAPLRRELGVPAGAEVVLFWGGLWDWMDPSLAVRALGRLRAGGRDAHLVFLAGARPGGDSMRAAADDARRVTAELGLSHAVHFLGRWIPYGDRGPILLDADVAVTAHRPSLEAELAFRTRLLDCLWAGLPVACTRGDALAAEAEREGWGAAADPGDEVGLARAIESLLAPGARDRARRAMSAAVDRYQWSRAAAVILALLDSPAPPRLPAFLPGEVGGESVLAVLRALSAKLIARLVR